MTTAVRSSQDRIFSLIALCLGMFLIILDSNVLNVALPTIGRELQTRSMDLLQWVVNSYTLVFAALLLTAGTVGDRRGTKGVFLFGVATFTCASLICGTSSSLDELIVGRMLQGLGAACLAPGSLSLIYHTHKDPVQRVRAIGIWAGISGIAFAAGPIVGGILVGVAGWRSVFFLNLPLGLAVSVLTALFVDKVPRRHTGGIDFLGQGLAMASLTSLIYAVTEGGRLGWSSLPIASLFGLSTASALLFIFWEIRADNPMLPLRLFSSRPFAIGNLIGLFYNFGLYGTLFLFSFFFQDLRKFTVVWTGLAFLPMTVTGALTSPLISGRVTSRYGLWPTLTIGLCSAFAGSILLSSIGLHSDYRMIAAGLLLFGFGTGMMAPAMTAAVLLGTPGKQSGLASAVLNASRQAGGVLGVAVFGAMISGRQFIPMMHLASRVVAGMFLTGIVLTLTFLRPPASPPNQEYRDCG